MTPRPFPREEIVNWSIGLCTGSIGFAFGLLIVHFVCFRLLPTEVRAHRVLLGPLFITGLSIFSWGLLPAFLILFLEDVMPYAMAGWGMLILVPVSAVTYLLTLATAYLRLTSNPNHLMLAGLLIAACFSLLIVRPPLFDGLKDLAQIVTTRFH
jgi:hypothetical protein